MFWIAVGFVLFNEREKIPIPTSRLSVIEKEYLRETALTDGPRNYYDKLAGYDMRFPGISDPNNTSTGLRKMEQKIDQLDLLKILENPGIGMRFKQIQLENYELLYGQENSMKSDLTAGGLFQDYEFDM